MKAVDLRIGNLVFLENPVWDDYKNIPMIITETSSDGRNDDMFPDSTGSAKAELLDRSNEFIQMDEFFAPIPLDETFSHFAETEKDDNGDVFVWADKQYDTRFYFSKGMLIYCKGYHCPLSRYDHIKYVHQFQNLFHAKIGREVKVL